MFNSLNGIITYKGDQTLFLDLNGLEWSIIMPNMSIMKLPPKGEKARVFTYLQHSQDSMQLFGFATERERSLFLDLLKVGGVGPKQAVKILSGVEIDNFVKQLDDGDIDALTRLPGLGKKTAQKIILALRGKLSFEEAAEEKNSDNELVNALVEMGFDRKASESAVKKASAMPELESKSTEEKEKIIFRQAIILLSG